MSYAQFFVRYDQFIISYELLTHENILSHGCDVSKTVGKRTDSEGAAEGAVV